MHFISNDHDAGRGFLGFYKQLGCGSHDRGPDKHPPPETTGLFYPKPYPRPVPSETRRQPSCDRLYALEQFDIESPGYPGSYLPGLDCSYFIRRLSERFCGLRVTFVNFDVEDGPDCHNDYFEIDGRKICGCIPEGKTKDVPLRDFQTTFRFHSNGAIENRGFLLRVQQIICEGGSPQAPPPSHHGPSSVPDHYPHYPAMGTGPQISPGTFRPPSGPAFGSPPFVSGGGSYYPPSGRGPPPGSVRPQPLPPVSGGHHGGPPPFVSGPPGMDVRPQQCDRMLNEPYFELKSTELGSGNVDCRIIVKRHGQDMCRLELLFVRFDVDCNQDQFRIDDVQICGRLDHYTTRSYNFEGAELYIYYHSSSGGRASDFLIKGRQTTCTGDMPPPPPPQFPADPTGRHSHGHGLDYPRHHGPFHPPPSPPHPGYQPPPISPPHYRPPAHPGHSMHGPPPSHYPPPPSSHYVPPPVPPSHYPPPEPHHPPHLLPPYGRPFDGGRSYPDLQPGYPTHQGPQPGVQGGFPPLSWPQPPPPMPPPPSAGRRKGLESTTTSVFSLPGITHSRKCKQIL